MVPVPPVVVVRILYVKLVVPEYAPNVVSPLLKVVVALTVVKDASGATVTPRVESAPKATGALARAATVSVRRILRFIVNGFLFNLSFECYIVLIVKVI
jgi:hypothetical protein